MKNHHTNNINFILMRHFKFILFLLVLLSPTLVFSQITYYNADQFPVIGKISNDTETRYERLGSVVKPSCNPSLSCT